MSWQASKQVWKNSKQTGGLKLTLLAIADFASPGNGWTCEAAIDTLAGMVGVSDRQIKKNLKALEACGELTIERQIGRGNTNRYSLNPLIKGEPEDTFYQDEKVNSSTEKVNSEVIKGEPEDTQTNITKLTNKNKTRAEEALIALFEGMTGFTAPYETTDNYADDWLQPAQAIISQSSDFAQAEERLTFAIQEMRKKRYTIKSPKSLLTFALNWNDGASPSGNGRVNKNELKDNLWTIVTRSKDYQEAQGRASSDEWKMLTSMGKWNDVRHLNETTFSIRFYEVYKQHAGN